MRKCNKELIGMAIIAEKHRLERVPHWERDFYKACKRIDKRLRKKWIEIMARKLSELLNETI
jgi:hypothetical protein